MKKIMVDDQYGLTQAVLEGRKTMTRRIVPEKTLKCAEAYVQKIHGTGHDFLDYLLEYAPFKPVEVVALAQNLRDMGYDPNATDWNRGHIWGLDHSPAWTNKLFVSAQDCIHQIRITGIKVERLQDISDADCLREGIERTYFETEDHDGLTYWDSGYVFRGSKICYNTPRSAFAALIDKVSGKWTWESNPWVFVYEFELVK